MSVTVDTLRTRAKRRADMENSDFVSASEWITYINAGYKNLYDLLVSKFEDYYITSSTFSVASGASTGSLPTDFYKLRGVDRSLGGGEYYTLLPFSFEKRNSRGYLSRYYGLNPDVRYRLLQSTLIFSPSDSAPGDYRIWYVPLATDLTSASDTVNGVNGWELYIELDAAIQAIIKEESDPSALLMERQKVEKRIEEMAANRDSGEVETIADVTGYNSGFFDSFYGR